MMIDVGRAQGFVAPTPGASILAGNSASRGAFVTAFQLFLRNSKGIRRPEESSKTLLRECGNAPPGEILCRWFHEDSASRRRTGHRSLSQGWVGNARFFGRRFCRPRGGAPSFQARHVRSSHTRRKNAEDE